MHSAPILIARVYRAGRVVGECGYHGYATQRFGVCVPSVPVAANGLEGWTSCCGAAVTFSDTTLVCKACYSEVATVPLDGDDGVALGVIVHNVITGAMTPDDGVAAQRRLLSA